MDSFGAQLHHILVGFVVHDAFERDPLGIPSLGEGW